MTALRTLANAKLNLTFDITGDLPGGFHAVETLFVSVDLNDTITFQIAPAARTTIHIDFETLFPKVLFPTDRTNLIHKAALAFSEQTGITFGLNAFVEKNIPVGAGLAGGSGNAAATLLALNAAFENKLSHQALHDLAARLGSDIPFSLKGGAAIGRNRGDDLTPVPFEKLHFCIVKPRKLTVPTPWAYQEFDKYKGEIQKPDLKSAVSALQNGDLESLTKAMGNVFEPVIFSHYPELAELKQTMLDAGAYACHLSGSGPALFALVADRPMAHHIRRKVLKNDDDGFEYGDSFASFEFGPQIDFFICETTDRGLDMKLLDKSIHGAG